MKYFRMTETSELKHAPKLIDWHGRFDVRDITLKSYPKLPDRQLFFVEPANDLQFTDMIQNPFLMISPRVRDVIKMYRELIFTKEIVLFEQQKGKPELYYLPVFDESEQVQLVIRRYEDGTCVSQTGQPGKEKASIDKHIFWVTEGEERHTILSLDLVESLIRRGITGLGLEEVQLYQKEQER